jgi:tripartite-type tricarboxylate transporter receptor subunit TctC
MGARPLDDDRIPAGRPGGFVLGALWLAAVLAAAGTVHAQEWPVRPVRWILSLPIGTGVDTTARVLAERLSRTWGQQVVVDNRPGGQSMIGAQAAARAANDGYNYFLATPAAIAASVHTFRKLPFDPEKDFIPVVKVGESTFVVAVGPKVPAASLAELIALDRAQPGKLALANQGPRSFGGMIGRMLNVATGMGLLQVSYNSPTVAIQDTVAGRIQAVLLSSGAITTLVKRGDLRALAVTSGRRLPGLEQVPTVAETVPGFEYTGWYALVAPTGTPAALVRRINRDVTQALAEPAIGRRLQELGIIIAAPGTPGEVGRFIRAERGRWGEVVRAIGLEPQ